MTEANVQISDLQAAADGKMIKSVKISGQLDESNVDEKIQEIYKLVEANPSGLHLIFDLEALEYMNSKSIGYLTDLYGKVSETGGKVVITRARPNILDILQVVGLTQLIPNCDTNDQALAQINGAPAPMPEQPETTPQMPAAPEPAPMPDAAPQPAAPAPMPEQPAPAPAPMPEQPAPEAAVPATEAVPAAPAPMPEQPMQTTPAPMPEQPMQAAPAPQPEASPGTTPAPAPMPEQPETTPQMPPAPEPAPMPDAAPQQDNNGTFNLGQ